MGLNSFNFRFLNVININQLHCYTVTHLLPLCRNANSYLLVLNTLFSILLFCLCVFWISNSKCMEFYAWVTWISLRVCLDRTYFAELKTYCWNHCSKIIFKCVNSTVGPIFNEKIDKKWNLWVHEQYIMYCLKPKSQLLRLLFIEQ